MGRISGVLVGNITQAAQALSLARVKPRLGCDDEG